MSTTDPGRREEVSGWAIGGIAFAGSILVLIGAFQFFQGLAAIIDDEFYVVARNYTYELDTSAWGWIHMILGVLLLVTGFALFARAGWAVVTAIVLAMLSALANFFFIPFYPFWSIVVIALNVFVIWALTRPGAIRED
jgi:hypothetical protein